MQRTLRMMPSMPDMVSRLFRLLMRSDSRQWQFIVQPLSMTRRMMESVMGARCRVARARKVPSRHDCNECWRRECLPPVRQRPRQMARVGEAIDGGATSAEGSDSTHCAR